MTVRTKDVAEVTQLVNRRSVLLLKDILKKAENDELALISARLRQLGAIVRE